MDFSKEEWQIIVDALLKARAQTETGYLEDEKRIIDSFHTAPNEDKSELVQDMYNRLLDKIKRYMDND
jgi:hypothetical protein